MPLGKNFSPYSKYLIIELINDADSLISRQKVECKKDGIFGTRIGTDPFEKSGIYYLRAYTQLMRNFNADSFTEQPLQPTQTATLWWLSTTSQKVHVSSCKPSTKKANLWL